MTDKERIKAEVIRYKNEIVRDNEGTGFEQGFIAALENIETFIDNMLEEPVSEDLANVADAKFFELAKLNDKQDEYEIRKIHQNTFRHIALYFANWQKEQMMRDAIEGLVVCDEILTHGYRDIVFKFPEELKVGDKVKMIIIKEEEK